MCQAKRNLASLRKAKEDLQADALWTKIQVAEAAKNIAPGVGLSKLSALAIKRDMQTVIAKGYSPNVMAWLRHLVLQSRMMLESEKYPGYPSM